MNSKQLIAHFHRLAEAPDAIPRLRRFILDLAVRGKLVPHDPKDEPAAKLLAASDQVRRDTSKSDRRADEKPQTLLGAEHCCDVPRSWEWRGLADLVLFIDYRGQTPNKTEHGVRLITAKNVKNGFLSLTPEEFLADADYAKWMTRGIPAVGDVLFTTEAPMGNAAVVELTERFALAQRVINFRLYGSLDSEFLKLQLIAPPFQFILDKAGTGMTAKGIKASKLKCLPIAVPPLAEQRRIVAKVTELMGLCDRLEAAQAQREQRRDRLAAATHAGLSTPEPQHSSFFLRHFPQLTTRPDQIPHLRQTILNLAVRGLLVPQDSEDEPASKLLAKVAIQKAAAGSAKTGRDWIGELDESKQQMFAAPNGWAWTRIGTAVERVTVGYVGPMKDQYVENGVPFLRSQNVRANKYRPEGLIYISDKFHQSIAKSALAPGDVVVVRSGNVGTACVIPDSLPEANCSDLVVVKRPIAVSPIYLCLYLNSLASVHIDEGTVGVALTHFNTKSVATMPLPLPPLAEQRRIVAKVEELMALCDQMERQLHRTQTESRRLLASVLHEALAA